MTGSDPIDRSILAALRRNARIAHARIGKMVNLSRNAVQQRIERMEARGIIGGYALSRPGVRGDLSTLTFVYRHDRVPAHAMKLSRRGDNRAPFDRKARRAFR